MMRGGGGGVGGGAGGPLAVAASYLQATQWIRA